MTEYEFEQELKSKWPDAYWISNKIGLNIKAQGKTFGVLNPYDGGLRKEDWYLNEQVLQTVMNHEIK